MIRKTDKDLLKWVYDNIVNFEDENDDSGLTWNSTREDAKKFLYSIPKKERVQKFGFYSTKSHFIFVVDFTDIKYCLKYGLISEKSCKPIYRWNSEVGRENWDMDDVREVLEPRPKGYRGNRQNFLYNTLKNLIELGVIECINPEVKTGKMFKLTQKGERILEET